MSLPSVARRFRASCSPALSEILSPSKGARRGVLWVLRFQASGRDNGPAAMGVARLATGNGPKAA